MIAKGIAVGVGCNLAPLQQGFGQALSQADRFRQSLSAKLGSLDTGRAIAQVDKIGKAIGKLDTGKAATPAATTGGGTGAGTDMAGAILPLAAQIGASLQKSMAPLASFAARFGSQFEKVAGTIVTLARRIDENMKFPRFQAWITGARGQVQAFAAGSEGRMAQFARGVDKTLGGIQGVSKLRNLFINFGDVAGRTINKLAGMKAPNVNFNSSTKSITNFYGATQAATGGLKAFGAQAALALGIFGLGFKAVTWIKTGITGAANLGETVSKTKEVFGEATGAIIAQADEMAAKFGIQKQVSLDAASSFGLIGKAAGLSGQGTADLANNFTKLAGDVSSFYNIPIDQALEKMRSGLVGEAEPMRALGVLLSEDAVKAEAWRSGIAKAGQELTDQQKVQARAALITKGLATASGDLERTQSSASNQARQFTGSMANLATTVGGFFLPALTKGLGLLNQFGSYLGRVFEENKATLEGWGNSLGTVFDYVGAAFMNLPGTFEIGRLIILQGLTNLGEEFDVLGPNIVRVAQWIGQNWAHLIGDAIRASFTLLKNFASNITALGEALGRLLADPTKGFEVNWTPLLDGFKSTVSEFPTLLKPQLTDMGKQIQAAKDKVFGGVGAGGSGAGVGGAKGSLMPSLGEPQSIKELKDITRFADKIKDDIKTPAEKFKEGMDMLTKAHDQKLLTDDEFERGKAQVARESGINQEAKFAGAVELGSKEAYSSVVGAISGRSNGMQNIEKSGQQTASNTASMAAGIKVIAQKFNAQEMVFQI